MKLIEFYRAQGVHVCPGYDKFLVGHVPMLRSIIAKSDALKGTEEPAPKASFLALLDETTESKAEDSYDFTKNQVSIINAGNPLLLIQDPEVVQEMMVTKNHLVDKSKGYRAALSNYFGQGFLFAASDDKWKRKRKGIAHAFFKDKLVVMLEKLKDYAFEAQREWARRIK